VLAGIFTFLKTYVIETRLGSVGTFFTMYSVSAVALRLMFSWVPDRVGPKRALYPALGLQVFGLLLLALGRSSTTLLAAGVLCGLGHGFVFPILTGLVVTRARDAERGSAIALFTAVFDLGTLAGGPIFGAMIENWGYPPMYLAAAALVVTGGLVFASWDRPGRRS
jgi:MFS family permease